MAEKELEYGVPYGDYSINADMKYINSDRYAKKFDKITDNPVLNKRLLECSRKAIEHRNGTYFEDMYLIDLNSSEILGSQTESAIEHGIVYNESINTALMKSKTEDIPLVSIHSHPEGYPPSVDDFNTAYKNGYAFSVVVGHNGQVYVYNTPDEVVENPNAAQRDIAFAYQSGLDIDRAYKESYINYNLKYFIVKE